jgi:hypothetical protein
MAQKYLFIAISFYRNIAILCVKMSRVNVDRCGADQHVWFKWFWKKVFGIPESELQVFLQLVSSVKAWSISQGVCRGPQGSQAHLVPQNKGGAWGFHSQDNCERTDQVRRKVHRSENISTKSSMKDDINILQVASKTASKHQKTVSLLGW